MHVRFIDSVGGETGLQIGNGVLIGAGACLLGDITIGTGTQIGAGSLVVTDLPERCVGRRFTRTKGVRIIVSKRHRRAGSAPRDSLRAKYTASFQLSIHTH